MGKKVIFMNTTLNGISQLVHDFRTTLYGRLNGVKTVNDVVALAGMKYILALCYGDTLN